MSALERCFLEKADLVLLNLVMRGMPGLDVLKTFQEMDANAIEILRVIAGVLGATA
jgi:CheY-like chemotaxis protein